MTTTLNILDFHDSTRFGNDMTPAVIAAMAKARTVNGPVVLQLPKGEYHFHPTHGEARTYYVSNNDYGTRHIMFPFIGMKDITLDGGGSSFILHGRVSPFVVDGSTNITIRNLTIDCERPFFTQGLILEGTHSYVDVLIDRETYPCRVDDGELILYGGGWQVEDDSVSLLMEFDPVTRAPSYHAGFFLAKFRRNKKLYNDKMLDEGCCVMHAEERPDGVLRIFGAFGAICRPGQMLVITHEKRLNAGLFVTESRNVTLEHVDFFQLGSMGVIAQLSETITLRHVNMIPKPGTDRLISVNADATHYVNCTGKITMENCVLEGMMDDGGNFHGIYSTVTKFESPSVMHVELMHFQQQGINWYKPGDRVSFVHKRLLDTFHTAVVKSSTLLEPKFIRLEFEAAVDGVVQVGDAVENPERMPELYIKNCRVGRNRPRGFLVSTSRKAVIEGCEFSNCALGVHMPGDANSWYESGGVRDVTVRGNTFRDCGYVWAHPPILIAPELGEVTDANPPCYHRNILIEDNLFETFDTQLLFARSVDGLVFRNNRYKKTTTYPVREKVHQPMDFKDCKNVTAEDATKVV